MGDLVTTDEAVRFLETACRNWGRVPRLSKADIEDVRVALQHRQTQAADEIARLRDEVKRLREPTPAMIEAGITAAENAVEETRDSYEAYRTDTPSDSVLPIYRAMIAAADDRGR